MLRVIHAQSILFVPVADTDEDYCSSRAGLETLIGAIGIRNLLKKTSETNSKREEPDARCSCVATVSLIETFVT